MSSRIRKNKSKNIKRLNQKILSESQLLKEEPNCPDHDGYCTAAVSCGGTNNYHGCLSSGGGSCETPNGTFDDYHMCGTVSGGGADVGHTMLEPEFGTDTSRPTKPTFGKKPMKKLKEGCGCNGAKETSEDSYMAASQLHSISNKAQDMYNKLEKDEVLDDWVESHLAKIDHMMDSVSDSFNHDESKDMGDMGTGGCPPGHHFCAASNSCRPDNPPQMEPLTLMGADVISLDESIKRELRLLNEQMIPGSRIYFSTAAYNLSNPQDLPGYDPNMYITNWTNSVGVPAVTQINSWCCHELGFDVDANNVPILQSHYFNGSTLKPGVYMSTDYSGAQDQCRDEFDWDGSACTYVPPIGPTNPGGNMDVEQDSENIGPGGSSLNIPSDNLMKKKQIKKRGMGKDDKSGNDFTKKIKEELKKKVVTEQAQSNARRIQYRTCQGSLWSHQNNVAADGQVPQVGDILRINTNSTGTGSIRTVMVLSVEPNQTGQAQFQNAQCQSSCPNCNICFNWTTMQNCDGTVGDPDCVVTGGTGSPGGFNAIECGSCGCTSTPPPPPPSGPYWCDNGSCVQTTPPTGAQVFGSLAACNSGCTPPPTASCSHLTMNFTCPDNANFVLPNGQNLPAAFLNGMTFHFYCATIDRGNGPELFDQSDVGSFVIPTNYGQYNGASMKVVSIVTNPSQTQNSTSQPPIWNFDAGGCQGSPNPSSTPCDQSAWSNYSTWLNNFTSLPNFSSSNPNQPCQFLCQRNTLWGDALSTGMMNGQQMGPNWVNQMQCKYDEVQSLMNTHNCSSSNAPAC